MQSSKVPTANNGCVEIRLPLGGGGGGIINGTSHFCLKDGLFIYLFVSLFVHSFTD